MRSFTCISWAGQWDSVCRVFEVALRSWGRRLCLPLPRRARFMEGSDSCVKECGLEPIVAFSV